MAHLLGAESVSVSYPTAQPLRGVTTGVDEGIRIGIMGRNGDSKSTLLRVLARAQELAEASGRTRCARNSRVCAARDSAACCLGSC